MKKLLLITLDFPPLKGGVARYYGGLMGALPKESVAILAEPHPDAEKFDAGAGYQVFRRRLIERRSWPRWKFIWQKLLLVRRKFHYEIILVGNILPIGYAALALKRFLRIQYGVFVHGLDILSPQRSLWKRRWVRKILQSASVVIANSHWTATRAVDVGANKESTIIIHPCPDYRRVDEKTVQSFRDRWRGKRILLSVGRLVSRKGHDMMIEALPDIIRAHPNAIWIVIGDGPEGERLRRMVSERALADHVVFRGVLSDVDLAAAYAVADVFVLPTREEKNDAEGFGLVFLEAGTAGVPVVAGRGGGVEEAVVDGVTGFVVDPRDPIAIANAVNRILSDKELGIRMGAAGRARVEKDFQWSQQAAKFDSSLHRLVP